MTGWRRSPHRRAELQTVRQASAECSASAGRLADWAETGREGGSGHCSNWFHLPPAHRQFECSVTEFAGRTWCTGGGGGEGDGDVGDVGDVGGDGGDLLIEDSVQFEPLR